MTDILAAIGAAAVKSNPAVFAVISIRGSVWRRGPGNGPCRALSAVPTPPSFWVNSLSSGIFSSIEGLDRHSPTGLWRWRRCRLASGRETSYVNERHLGFWSVRHGAADEVAGIRLRRKTPRFSAAWRLLDCEAAPDRRGGLYHLLLHMTVLARVARHARARAGTGCDHAPVDEPRTLGSGGRAHHAAPTGAAPVAAGC